MAMTTGSSRRGDAEAAQQAFDVDVGFRGPSHSWGMRLRARNSRTWPVAGGEPRPDHADGGGGAAHADTARRARNAARIVSLNVGFVAMRCRRASRGNGDHLARLGRPGRDEHPLAGEQVQLAEEAAGPMGGDHPALRRRRRRRFHLPRDDREEVVGGVTLPVQDSPTATDRRGPSGSNAATSASVKPLKRIGFPATPAPSDLSRVQPRDLRSRDALEREAGRQPFLKLRRKRVESAIRGTRRASGLCCSCAGPIPTLAGAGLHEERSRPPRHNTLALAALSF